MSDSIDTLSDSFADAVESASASTLIVHGRRRRPATGTVWQLADGGRAIVTASHVVEREDNLHIRIGTEKHAATLLGRDVTRDIAILSTEAELPSPIAVREREARVGNIGLAIGFVAPNQVSASFGVINSIGTIWFGRGTRPSVIHTDVEMLPGFSGGPLIDSSGAAFGILTSGLVAPGSGVAIPAAHISRIANEIVTYGEVRNGWIGITSQVVAIPENLRDLVNGQEVGLLISDVSAESPAQKGGVIVGDILVALGDHPTADATDIQQHLGGDQIDQPITATVLRGGAKQELELVPTARPRK